MASDDPAVRKMISGTALLALAFLQVWTFANAFNTVQEHLSSSEASGESAGGNQLVVALGWAALALIALYVMWWVHCQATNYDLPFRCFSWHTPGAAWGISMLAFVVLLGMVAPHFTEMSAGGLAEVDERTGWTGFFTALRAGVMEEIMWVGAPLCLGLWLASRLTSKTFKAMVVLVAVVVGSLCRAVGHYYQSETHALVNLALGVVLALAFLRWRSLWPLMISHATYDLVTFLYRGQHQDTLLLALGAVAFVAIAVTVVRSVAGRRSGEAAPRRREPISV